MCPVARCRRGLRRDLSGSALPTLPQSVSRGARFSRLHWFANCYGLSGCSPPWTDRTKFPWSTGDFYIQASDGSVALPAAGYDYNSHWTPLLAGLSLAGMAASLAAPDLRGADLSYANLGGADLYGATLSEANLTRTTLSYANLHGTGLSDADLTHPLGWLTGITRPETIERQRRSLSRA